MSLPCPTLGFTLDIELHAGAHSFSAPADDLAQLLHANDLLLVYQGSRGRGRILYAIAREGSPATSGDRELLLDWAARWRDEAIITVSDLTDVSSMP